MAIDFGDIVAFCALCLAAYSTKKTFDFNRRQKEFIETHDALNKLLLRKESNEAINELSADLSANFIKLGSNQHRLKVFNKGKGIAKNVRIEFPEGNDLVLSIDIESKFPVPILEQFQSVELIASVGFGSPSRMAVKLIWDDDEKHDKSKVVTPTI